MRRKTIVTVVFGALAVMACHSPPAARAAKLESITIAPRTARRTIGEEQHFTAIGHYAGGTTRNLTQHVQWTTSDPAVAQAANAKGNRSRIEAKGAGTAVISATDPASGVTTHATNDDATFVVLGKLEHLALAPESVHRTVGQTQTVTAIGHYEGGTTRNVTQHVTYRSSDPEVAAVKNADGDKSRVEMVGVGSATISAVDPATGVTSAGADVSVTVTLPTLP